MTDRIVYLARRHPSFASREAWVPRWREHWALADAQPESSTVRRYAQCEVVHDEASPPHDAVAYAEYWSREERIRNRSSTGYHAIMRADELKVFARGIRECSFIGEFELVVGTRDAPWKVIRFVRDPQRAAAAPPGDLSAAARSRTAEFAAATPTVRGAAVTVALPPPPGGWGLDVDLAEEFWFDTLEHARALHALLRGRSGSGDGDIVACVVTDEVVLRDRS